MLSLPSTRPSDAPGRDHPRSSIRTPRRHRPPLRRNEGPRRLAWRGRGTRWTRQRQAWRRRSEAVRRPRDPTIVAHGPRGKSTLSPGERPLSSRQRTALVKNVSRMREERGADPRPACSAGRTAGPLHAVPATHPPRLLQARNSRHVAARSVAVEHFCFSGTAYQRSSRADTPASATLRKRAQPAQVDGGVSISRAANRGRVAWLPRRERVDRDGEG